MISNKKVYNYKVIGAIKVYNVTLVCTMSMYEDI